MVGASVARWSGVVASEVGRSTDELGVLRTVRISGVAVVVGLATGDVAAELMTVGTLAVFVSPCIVGWLGLVCVGRECADMIRACVDVGGRECADIVRAFVFCTAVFVPDRTVRVVERTDCDSGCCRRDVEACECADMSLVVL